MGAGSLPAPQEAARRVWRLIGLATMLLLCVLCYGNMGLVFCKSVRFEGVGDPGSHVTYCIVCIQ